MKALTPLLITSSRLAAGAASAAEPIVIDVPRDAKPAVPTVTRAEVLADLYLWRAAGMEDFPHTELMQGERYEAALARYRAMRESPQYAELVKKIEGRSSAPVVGR